MTNLDDAHALIEGLRQMNDPAAGLMAHTIEAALDDALGIPIAAGERLLALNAADAKRLRASLQLTLNIIDGRDPDFAPGVALAQRIAALDFAEPDVEPHWRDDEHTGPLEAPEEPASEAEDPISGDWNDVTHTGIYQGPANPDNAPQGQTPTES